LSSTDEDAKAMKEAFVNVVEYVTIMGTLT